jgi:hypothetical protein
VTWRESHPSVDSRLSCPRRHLPLAGDLLTHQLPSQLFGDSVRRLRPISIAQLVLLVVSKGCIRGAVPATSD